MKDTIKICGLRFQKYDNGTVHIHDYARNIKFIGESKAFKNDVQGAFEELLEEQGIIEIKGTSGVSLYIGKDGNSYFAFLKYIENTKTQIQDFLKML